MRWWSICVVLCAATAARAEVGSVSQLEGAASRTPRGQRAPIELQVGSPVEVGDTLEVAAGGNLAVTLADRSVLALGEKSRLEIDEARFGDQGSRSFSARLALGTLWAKVTKLVAGSESKFEVTTERGVAGVRGTIFTVDFWGADGDLEVGVEEGEVEVAHGVGEAPGAMAVAMAEPPSRAGRAAAAPSKSEVLDRASGAGAGPPRAAAAAPAAAPAAATAMQPPPSPEPARADRTRFTRLERIQAGGSVTFGKRELARHRFQLRHARMAAFIGKHRERWLQLALERERERKELRKDLRQLRQQRRSH